MESPVLQMILSLSGVLLLMMGLSYAAKRFFGVQRTSRDQKISIEVLGQRAFHTKQSIYVLRICGKGFIVSATEEKIQLIGEISEEDLRYHMLQDSLSGSTAKQSIVNSTKDFVTQLPSIQELFSSAREKRTTVIKKRSGSTD